LTPITGANLEIAEELIMKRILVMQKTLGGLRSVFWFYLDAMDIGSRLGA
jgi:hypothetical protein